MNSQELLEYVSRAKDLAADIYRYHVAWGDIA